MQYPLCIDVYVSGFVDHDLLFKSANCLYIPLVDFDKLQLKLMKKVFFGYLC